MAPSDDDRARLGRLSAAICAARGDPSVWHPAEFDDKWPDETCAYLALAANLAPALLARVAALEAALIDLEAQRGTGYRSWAEWDHCVEQKRARYRKVARRVLVLRGLLLPTEGDTDGV